MEVPNPLPRRKSKGNAFASDSTDHEGSFPISPQRSSAIQLIHRVEVHTSIGSNSASSENSLAADKKKKRLRRKSTFSISKKKILKSEESLKNAGDIEIQNINENDGGIQKDGNETFSDRSSSPSSNKIKLIPLLDSNKKKKPSGYATETLSDESESEHPFVKPSVPPRTKIPIKISENNDSTNTTLPMDIKKVEVDSTVNNAEIESNLSTSSHHSPPPLPFPRKSLNKSVENLLATESNRSIHGSPQSYCTSSSLDYRDTGTLPKQRLKKHKKKKKLKDSNSEDIQDSHVDKNETMSEKLSPLHSKLLKSPKKNEFICITIHRCEPLQIKDLTTKPFVKVMILDIESGKQKVNNKGEAIEPVATQPYDYTFQRSSTPRWEEDLIILESLDIFKNPNTILLIGILDEEKNKVLAWGFLKLLAANGATNIGKQLRLQLLKPPGKSIKDNLSSQMFMWWKSGGHKNYKSTLFVTVNGIPENIVVQNNVGESSKTVLKITTPEKSVVQITSEKEEDRDLEDVRWGRLPSLSCKLPNKYLARLPAGPDGSLAIAYSHSGLFLASANKISVCVYTFRGRLHLLCRGHHGLVYCLKWSPNDKYLLSVSADTSACVWDISNKTATPIQSVSHPSYVYSCAWLDNNNFVTGCFDNDIRIWEVGATKVYQQASHHKGKVNTLLSYDNYLISGDSVGEICIWNWNPGGNLEFERSLVVREINGKVINKVSLHPGKKRLLVHTRDSVLRMVDISTGSVLHWFQGLVNTKLREDSTFCGCGSLVLAWSEDSTLCVWDSNTSAQAAIYPNLIPDSQPGVIDFHPRDHMMAVSAHSSITPVLSILVYDRLSSGREVGLVPLTGGISSISLNSDRSSGHSSDRSSESTPKKKEGLLKILLGSKKKVKKENSDPPFTENSFTDFTRLSGGVSRQLNFTDSAPKESRLGDIIKRMDRILTSVSNNSSLYTS